MKFLKYYWNPMVFSIGMAAYFAPFYLPMERGDLSGIIAVCFMILVLWGLLAWLVALGQLLVALANFRKEGTAWKHHGASALWTYLCYGVFITLAWNGYLLTV